MKLTPLEVFIYIFGGAFTLIVMAIVIGAAFFAGSWIADVIIN